MKVIDLLNKIAKGEIPKKIKCKEMIFSYKDTIHGTGYLNIDEAGHYNWFEDYIEVESKEALNKEVEILEDEEIDIQEIEEYKTNYSERCIDVEVREKINEIIRVVNKMQKTRLN